MTIERQHLAYMARGARYWLLTVAGIAVIVTAGSLLSLVIGRGLAAALIIGAFVWWVGVMDGIYSVPFLEEGEVGGLE